MVNTFLPYPDFKKSARVLDPRRLGKQRIEALQIIDVIGKIERDPSCDGVVAWSHHPAVQMWKGYSNCLKGYYNEIVKEWIRRGYVNNMKLYPDKEINLDNKPWWFGFDPFHLSHQGRLYSKEPDYYLGKFAKTLTVDYIMHGYVWPSRWQGSREEFFTSSIQILGDEITMRNGKVKLNDQEKHKQINALIRRFIDYRKTS